MGINIINHTKLFKILFIEDLPSDVDLEVRELRKANFQFEYSTVCTKTDLQKALPEFKPDLIISDYMMPSFNGMQALKISKEYDDDLPFILCTGSVNEEVAIDCIKAGAMDYVTKQHMTRLPFAVKDALDKVRISKEKKAYDLLLKENEAKLQSIFSASQIGIGLVVNRILIEVNDFFCNMMGYERRELIGKSSEILYSSNHEYVTAGKEKYRQISEKGTGSVETIFKQKNGKFINVIVSSAPLDVNDLSKGVSFTVLDITDRKKAVDELLESHRSINTLISNIQGLVYRCRNDKHFTALFLSQGARELTGYIPEDFLENKNISFKDIINKDDQGYVWTEIQKALKSREHWEITYRIITKSGNLRWVWEKGEGIFLPNGDLEFLEGFITDITQQKKNDEALKESRLLFETLAKTSPVGIFRTKLDGFTTYVNPKWQELSGLTFEQSLGFNWLNAVHPDDRNFLELKWKSDVSKLKESVAEYRFVKADGTISWVMGNAVPEKIENEVIGYIGTVTDITAHHIIEESLRKSEEKYRRIFENVQDVYYETSIDGKIIEVSPSIEFLSRQEYQVENLIGRPMDDFYSDPKERQLITEELKEKGHVTDFEVTFRNNDGLKYPCSVSAKLLFDEHGIPEKIIGSIRDITDRKNASDALKLAKEKAEMSDRLKTDFLNNISHEVRTPLNGILGFAEIISLPDLSEQEKKDSHAMLLESSDRLLNTITNYMDISIITSGNLTINRKNFSPAIVLRKLFENFEAVCLNRNLKLFLEIPEKCDDYCINSDPEICRKIITHFLDNAVKFTENGSIHFGFNRSESHVELFVQDTGIGINADSFNIIFERFMKDSLGPFGISEGSGLGLSIAHGMAEAIGGKISLESKLGVGSSFFLSIPVPVTEEVILHKSSEKSLRKSKTARPILVAEDDETNFYYLNTLLNKETDSKILHALNGEEAVMLFKANLDVELILMDIKMPKMDGFEATRQIKLLNKNVHIIAITAYAMSGDEAKVIEAGCDGYLSKPINRKSLLNKIGEFIKG